MDQSTGLVCMFYSVIVTQQMNLIIILPIVRDFNRKFKLDIV